jgi:ubiquitin carboxyl-terminal hydrolase 14
MGDVQVSFPLQLDLFDLCTPELQVDLKGPRAACWAIEESLKGPQGGSSAQKNDKPPQDKEAGADRDSEMAGTAEAGAMSDQNFTGKMTGRFDLVACLTHRGRTLDSGHYVAWVKQKGDDCWIQFDDEKLIPRKSEEILALKGGGDWHTAYLLLYKAQRVPAKEARAVQQEAH